MADAVGQMGATNATSEYNEVEFVVNQILGRIATATIVEVKAVNAAGVGELTASVGTVDVLPLVNQQDGAGNITQQQTVYGLPYIRIQGGANAVIIDPKVGDKGLAVFCMRDISSVKANRKQSNPGSRRTFSYADGIYFGSLLSGVPTQYFQFIDEGAEAGVKVVSTTKVTIQAPVTHITGALTLDGTLTSLNATLDTFGNFSAKGDVIAGLAGTDQVSLRTHVHISNGVPPTPGT